MLLIVNTISEEVRGAPSCQNTFFRRAKVYVSLSSEIFGNFSARSGTSLFPRCFRRPVKRRYVISRSTSFVWDRIGLTRRGVPITPSMYSPPISGIVFDDLKYQL